MKKIRKDRKRTYVIIGTVSLLLSLIVGLLGYSNTNDEIERIKTDLITKYLENNLTVSEKYMHREYGTLTAGQGTLLDEEGESIHGRQEFVDSIVIDLGDQATIFVREKDDFKRIATNVVSGNKRALDTYLGKDHPAYDYVINGRDYIGRADVLGTDYYTAYKPIKDRNQNTIGLLFIGTPAEDLDVITEVHYSEMNTINTFVLVFRAITMLSLFMLAFDTIKEQYEKPLG